MHHTHGWYSFHGASLEGLQPIPRGGTAHLYYVQSLGVKYLLRHRLEKDHKLSHLCPIHLMSGS
jgi:hypothetical protein